MFENQNPNQNQSCKKKECSTQIKRCWSQIQWIHCKFYFTNIQILHIIYFYPAIFLLLTTIFPHMRLADIIFLIVFYSKVTVNKCADIIRSWTFFHSFFHWVGVGILEIRLTHSAISMLSFSTSSSHGCFWKVIIT